MTPRLLNATKLRVLNFVTESLRTRAAAPRKAA